MHQSCGNADKAVVYPFCARAAGMWRDKIKNRITRSDDLHVISLSLKDTGELAKIDEPRNEVADQYSGR